MCESGEEVEYQLVCRRTGEVVGMAYIRPQEEANLHNLLLGPEEELGDVKKDSINDKVEEEVESPKIMKCSSEELLEEEKDAKSETISLGTVVESRRKMAAMAAQMLATTPVQTKALGEVKGPNLGLRQPCTGAKGDLGAPGRYGWQREVVYEGHTRCAPQCFTQFLLLSSKHLDSG